MSSLAPLVVDVIDDLDDVAEVDTAWLVFVPAVMGAGLVFSVATLLRDVVSRGSRGLRDRRARLRGEVLAARVVHGDRADISRAAGAATRRVLTFVGLVSCALGLYVAIGATGNFLRAEGYLSDIAWLWGASVTVSIAAIAFGAVCLVAAARPSPPAWVWPTLLRTPLVGMSSTAEPRNGRLLLAGSLALVAALTAFARWPRMIDSVDERLADAIGAANTDWLTTAGDVLGSTELSVVVAVIVGLATLRCRRLAWVFVVSVALSLGVTTILREAVDRARPLGGVHAGSTDSFPSGHMVQATLLALLLPIAVYELSRSRPIARAAAAALAVAVAVVAFSSMAEQRHHPSDVLAGLAIAVAIATWARMTISAPGAHRRCTGCTRARAIEEVDARAMDRAA